MEVSKFCQWLFSVWLLVLLGFYTAVSLIGLNRIEKEKQYSYIEHRSIINPNMTQPGKTRAEVVQTPDDNTLYVTSGMYIERITGLSFKQSLWHVDFYIWFKWPISTSGKINPGKTFHVVDGELLGKPLLIDAYETNKTHYRLYRARARVTKFFNMTRFPRDDHMLTLRIEDKKFQYNELHYVPDEQLSNISSRVEIPGYAISKGVLLEKPHSYKTNMGDPRLAADYKDTHSQLLYSILIRRPGWGLYWKLFQGMFAAVSISLLAFLVLPSDKSRFPFGIGAFFASVASTYVTTNQLPGVGVLTLTDVVNGVGMATIFLTLLSSIVSHYLYAAQLQDGEQVVKPLFKYFDRVVLLLIGCGYFATNFFIAYTASL